jgi:hypothetical protein
VTPAGRLGLLYLLLILVGAWWILIGQYRLTEATDTPEISTPVPGYWQLNAERRARLAGRYALELEVRR